MVDFIDHEDDDKEIYPLLCSECGSTMLNAVDGYECCCCGHYKLGTEECDEYIDEA